MLTKKLTVTEACDPSQNLGLGTLVMNHLSAYFQAHGEILPCQGLYERVLREVEKPLILETLKMAKGNQMKAAEILGIHRNTLRKKMQDLVL